MRSATAPLAVHTVQPFADLTLEQGYLPAVATAGQGMACEWSPNNLRVVHPGLNWDKSYDCCFSALIVMVTVL